MSSPPKVSSSKPTTTPVEPQNYINGSGIEPSNTENLPVVSRPNTSLVPMLNVVSESASVSQNEKKPPGNLQQLLTLSTSLQSTTRDNEMPQDDEKQKFLFEALNQMTASVEVELKKAIEFLSTDLKDNEECETVLDGIIEQVCSLDVANLFYQLGGLDALVPLLISTSTEVRCKAANIVAECCQNNDYCAQMTTCSVVFNILMDLASKEDNTEEKFQALSAISAIIRNNKTGVARFQLGNGYTLVRDTLNTGNDKIISKVAFLIISLCDTEEQAKHELVSLGVVESLISLAEIKSDLLAEYFLRALVSITKNCPEAIKECLKPEYGFRQFLKKIISTKQTDEACVELVESAMELQKRFNKRGTT